MPEIYLYAEILTHIKQLTLYASLQNPKDAPTQILVSSDKKIITVLHDGQSSSIYLPTQISGTADVAFPEEKRTEFSCRLQIDDLDQLKPYSADTTGIDVPWSAADLTRETSVRCKNCEAELLPPNRVTTWKDLPSENWAELMDFWFCHKPHGPDQGDDRAAETKGFSSKSKVSAAPGVGFVDTVSFLVESSDCCGAELVAGKTRNQVPRLCCSSCGTGIGSGSQTEKSYRLFKSRLAVRPGRDRESEVFPTSTVICAQLLSLIESSVSRKVIVHTDMEQETTGLLLWIFNPDIYYSSSKKGPSAHRAMKVFYKSIQNPLQLLDGKGTTHEELVIPDEDFRDLVQTLLDGTSILPESARRFQDWDVGLLDRYEKRSTGAIVMDQNPLNRQPGDIELFSLPAGMRELYV